MDVTLEAPIIPMLVSGGTALLVYYLDRRRTRRTDKGHRAVIARSMGDLDEMVAQVMLGVGDMGVRESDETIPERLSQYLARNYRRAELAAHTIEVHGAMCTALSRRDKNDVETAVRFVRWLLDVYHPQDVGPEARHKAWVRHPLCELKKRALEMRACVSRFTRAPGPAPAVAPGMA